MAINKVQYGNTTLIDLTGTTATADKILTGYGAYGKDGVWMDGSATQGGGIESVTQDQDGYVVLDDDEGNQIIVDELSVTRNGTYTATTGHAYSPVTVNVANSYSAGDEGKVVSNGALVSQTSATYTSNNTYDTTLINSVTVNVSGITPTGTLSITQNGTYNVTNYASADVNVSSSPTEKAGVRFIDYDGTILNTYTYSEAMALSALPSNPSHTGLTSQGWNWTLTDIKSELEYSDGGYIDVGQMYITDDGKTRLYVDIETPDGDLPTKIGFYVSSGSTVTINWGDNSAEEYATATSYTDYTHSYASAGSYVISLSVSNDGTIYFEGNMGGARHNIMGTFDSTTIADFSAVYRYNLDKLKKIELGSNVNLIMGYFLHYCKGLKYITIPSYFETIPSIQYCEGLKCIIYPSNVQSVTTYAFNGCYSLEYFSNNVTVVNTSAFTNCRSLKNVFFKKTAYANGAQYMFDGCFSLEYASFPRRSLSLNGSSYNNCYSLKKMTLYNDNGLTYIPANTFYNCYSLRAVEIPNGFTSIENYAFYTCQNLTSVTLPNTLTYINQYGFSATGIENITLPNSMTGIQSYSFSSCKRLKHVDFPNVSTFTTIASYSFNGCSSLTDIDISNTGVTSIQNNTFANCTALQNVKLRNAITSFGNYAFDACNCLQSINIPTSLTTLGTYCFRNCLLLNSIELPNTVTAINNYAFYGCANLNTITLPSTITTFGSNVFYGCISLMTIELPTNITTIPSNTFYNCYSLRAVEIPSNVTVINSSSFYNCYKISNITIPSSVTSIGNSAFYGCTGMKEYHLLSATPPTLLNTNAFTSIPSNCIIYVPQGSLTTYQTASNWSTYASYMREESA